MKKIMLNATKQILIRRLFLVLLDILIINFTTLFAFATRHEFSISSIMQAFIEPMLRYAPIHTCLTLIVFYCFRLYQSLWKYAGIEEMTNVIYASTIATIIQFIGMRVMGMYMFRSYYPLCLLYLICFVGGSRFLYRMLRKNNGHGHKSQNHIMIIGAGDAASTIIKEIIGSKFLDGKVACAIDDNKNKLGSYIQGVKIVGDRSKITWAVEHYHITDIIIANPSLSRRELKDILEICKETRCTLKILPAVYQLINEEVTVSRLRNVEIEDLLGREPIELDTRVSWIMSADAWYW